MATGSPKGFTETEEYYDKSCDAGKLPSGQDEGGKGEGKLEACKRRELNVAFVAERK